jgi:adenosine deaminase
MDRDSQKFVEHLREGSLDGLQAIPKSDLHNHAGRGGNLCYICAWANAEISPPKAPFESLGNMQEWFEQNIKIHCPGKAGYLKRIEAAFVQAEKDNIQRLALSFGLGEIETLGGMEPFMQAMDALHHTFAPNTAFLPELALDRACGTVKVYGIVEKIFSFKWFVSVDICCNELAQPIHPFQKIYRLAKEMGLTRKAHVGEFGSAEDVLKACEVLELQEVHHGIAAANSKPVMSWLAHNKIQLNICPTSNIMLGRVEGYWKHPIRILYDHGIPVTINTDDLLIFNQSVSQEYMNLFQAGLMTAEELDEIRLTGLSNIHSAR